MIIRFIIKKQIDILNPMILSINFPLVCILEPLHPFFWDYHRTVGLGISLQHIMFFATFLTTSYGWICHAISLNSQVYLYLAAAGLLHICNFNVIIFFNTVATSNLNSINGILKCSAS